MATPLTLLRNRRVCLAAILTTFLVLLSCEVQTDVTISVSADGSGKVEVAVGLDEAALAQIPDLEDQVRTEDMETAGWTVSGPIREEDGNTWLRAEKSFEDPEGLGEVVAEVAGPEGALRDFTLERNEAFALTTWELSGVVDLSGGLEQFSDPALTQALGGLPLGVDLEAVAAETGVHLEESFTVRLIVDLPGEIGSSNAASIDGGAVWEWELVNNESEVVGALTGVSEPIEVTAKSSDASLLPRILVGIAIVAVSLAVLMFLLPLLRRRRRG